MNNNEYDIALSFAGEDRNYVEQVASLLNNNNIKVFYDDFEKPNLWGKNLYEYLSDIYKNKAKYTIIFISEHYAKKLWTNHERESAQARAFSERKEYILPAKFDDTEIIGIHETIGYIDLRYHTPEEFVNIILDKLHNTLSTSSKTISNLGKTYVCPYCRSKVSDGTKICLGCKAEVVYGSTANEREENFKFGAGLGIIFSFLIFILMINKIKEHLHFDFYMYVHPFVAFVISIAITLFSAKKLMNKENNKRLDQAPRFFQRNMVG